MNIPELLTQHLILQSVYDAIIVIDPQSRILVWNLAAEAIYGWPERDVLGQNITDIIPVARFRGTTANTTEVRAILARDGVWSGRVIQRHRIGRGLIIDGAARPIRDAQGTVIATVAINRDVTGRVHAEELSRLADDQLRMHAQILDNMSETVITTDLGNRITSWNRAADRMYRLTANAALGKDIVEACSAEYSFETSSIGTVVANVLDMGSWTWETIQHHRDGLKMTMESTSSVLRDAQGMLTGIVLVGHDITARKQAEAKLLHHAFYDYLTDLPNRALFLDRLDHVLIRLRRVATGASAVLFLDLDQFKAINDSLGHRAGDQLLIVAARRLTTAMRTGDTLARFGGDEFAVLLEDIEDVAHAIQVVERIHQILAEPFIVEGRHMAISASIGITLALHGEEHPDDVVRNADIAMYRAKAQGLGKYVVFDPAMHTLALARLASEDELRHAIEHNQFVLHYQPIVELESGTIAGVEALVRWQHPLRGLLLPGEFLPLCEEAGLIVSLGEQILRMACMQMMIWHQGPVAPPYVSVNIATEQLHHCDLPQLVTRVLEETGLAPQFLAIELTEASILDEPTMATLILQQLRDIGLHSLAIDDFGTGYSSLSYLQHLPITAIKIDLACVREKIDLACVRDMIDNPALARAIIAMAHGLDVRTVAEGVETGEQRALLQQYGCDMFQGYLVSPPIPADALMHLLRAAVASDAQHR